MEINLQRKIEPERQWLKYLMSKYEDQNWSCGTQTPQKFWGALGPSVFPASGDLSESSEKAD